VPYRACCGTFLKVPGAVASWAWRNAAYGGFAQNRCLEKSAHSVTQAGGFSGDGPGSLIGVTGGPRRSWLKARGRRDIHIKEGPHAPPQFPELARHARGPSPSDGCGRTSTTRWWRANWCAIRCNDGLFTKDVCLAQVARWASRSGALSRTFNNLRDAGHRPRVSRARGR